jgi:PKD repeat protein
MPKVSTIRPLFVCLVAVLTAACAGNAPTAASTPVPARGTPAKIEISATPGIGANGGTAAVTARVLDAYFATVPDVDVAFAADAGTFAQPAARTDDHGIATTSLSAAPGIVKVTASAGSVRTTEIPVEIQPNSIATPPAPQPPPPVPPAPPSSDQSFTISIGVSPAGAGLTTSFGMVGSGPVTSANWTFGDGQTGVSAGPSTTHIYATANTYAVSVVATDSRGRTASASTSVVIPAGGFAVTLASAPVSVQAGTPVTLTATATPQNTTLAATNFLWDCDNGSPASSDGLTTHQCIYATIGTKAPRVTASNGAITGTASTSVTVTSAPLLVGVVANPAGPVASGSSVTFTATITSAGPLPANVRWDWDDQADGTFDFTATSSSTSDARTIVVTSAATAVWQVHVRATDIATGATGSGTGQVTSTGAAVPVVAVACTTVAANTVTDCFATATLNGAPATITNVSWNWGDPSTTSTTTDGHGTHTYTAPLLAPGYAVTATVTVTGGATTAVGHGNAIVQ